MVERVRFPAQVEAAVRTDELVAVMAGPFHLNRWNSAPTHESMRALGDALAKWAPGVPGGKTAGMAIIDAAGARRMDEDTRSEAGRLQGFMDDYNVAVAQVVSGSRFMASAARAVINGIHLLSRRSHASEVFSNAEMAIPWVVDHFMAESKLLVDRQQALDTWSRMVAVARGE